MTRQWLLALIGCLFLSACGGNNPYLEQSLKPAELQGKEKSWFLKNWGEPSGRAPRFFGGETEKRVVVPRCVCEAGSGTEE